MRRPDAFAEARWDDPFWHVVRMLVDETRGRVLAEAEILRTLGGANTEASRGLARYLSTRQEMLPRLAEYTQFRVDAAEELLARARTEEEALADFAQLSPEAVARYGTRSSDHHQSSKVMVATIEFLTRAICLEKGLRVDVNPQKRATIVSGDHIWVSPRRLDGAMPSLFNPVGLWEIKEYWGGTAGGSKMSDAIYECQLVGQELRTFEDRYGHRVLHYAILDGVRQWAKRKSDLRRAVDLLCGGLLDELLVGSEVLAEWPRIISEMTDLVRL
jgi:plasmid stabilization system protein ParE